MCFGNVAAFLWPLLAGVAADRPLTKPVNGTVAGLIEEGMVQDDTIFIWADCDGCKNPEEYNDALERVFKPVVNSPVTHYKEYTMFTRPNDANSNTRTKIVKVLLGIFDGRNAAAEHGKLEIWGNIRSTYCTTDVVATLTLLDTNIDEYLAGAEEQSIVVNTKISTQRQRDSQIQPPNRGMVVYHSVHSETDIPFVGERKLTWGTIEVPFTFSMGDENIELLSNLKVKGCSYAFFHNRLVPGEFHWHFVCKEQNDTETEVTTFLNGLQTVKFTPVTSGAKKTTSVKD